MRYIKLHVVLLALCGLAPGVASAQNHGSTHPPHASAAQPAAAPMGMFAVRTFGGFRETVHRRDYAAKVQLSDVRAGGATDAVGAVTGLRGEITMIDGRFLISYGGGCSDCPPPHAQSATLLGTATVSEWSDPIVVPANLTGKALDDFIVSRAQAAGLDLSAPFPVRLKGNLIDVEMHVIAAPNPEFAGHGSHGHMAKQDELRHAVIAGEVVGMYAPEKMQGILTHPGEPFHFHWVDDQRTRTAHLDAFGMQQGAVLLLPRK